ncbi:MAG: hypothetical protein Q4C86_12775 [bacterium]|nr:hypothetical protein [bacterium]
MIIYRPLGGGDELGVGVPCHSNGSTADLSSIGQDGPNDKLRFGAVFAPNKATLPQALRASSDVTTSRMMKKLSSATKIKDFLPHLSHKSEKH